MLPSLPDPPATYDGGDPVPLGEAVKRTLHELMAADERIRVFGEDVADAREVVLSNVEGKGGVFGTTSRPAAGLRPGPLLQHAAVGGQHRRPGRRAGAPGAAAGPGDPVLRLHLAGHDPDQERGGDHPLALERGLHLPDGDPGADRRLPHRRRHLAQPVRREHLRPRPRAAHRLPLTGPRRRRAAAGRVRRRGPRAVPRAQAPAAPALHRRPVPAGRLRHPVRPGRRPPPGRRLHDRHVGRDGREDRCRPRRGWRRRRATRSRSSTCAPSRRGTTTSSRRRSPARTACSSCTRTC